MHKLGCRTFSSARVFGGAVLYCTEEKVIELPCPARIERERKESYAHRMVEVVVTWYWIHVGRDRDRDRGVDVERTERNCMTNKGREVRWTFSGCVRSRVGSASAACVMWYREVMGRILPMIERK